MASAEQIKALLKSHGDGEDDRFFSVAMQISGTVAKGVRWQRLADLAVGLSYAEITRASNEALKDALIHERPRVRETDIRTMLAERRRVAEGPEVRSRSQETSPTSGLSVRQDCVAR